MLKIKDDVDLKELEKFGFKQSNYDKEILIIIYKDELYVEDYIEVDKIKRILTLGHYQEEYGACYLNVGELLYDLIQAGLVEKVEG